MNKRDFINEYRIFDSLPIDPSSRVLPAEGFAIGIEEFINERFRGVARARSSVISYSAVSVSTEYVALFFKLLLAEIHGRCFLDIELSSDPNEMTIKISWEGQLPLDQEQIRDIIRTARNGGMHISVTEEKIELKLCFVNSFKRRVYAISVNDGRRVIMSKFNEIFSFGDPYPVEGGLLKKMLRAQPTPTRGKRSR